MREVMLHLGVSPTGGMHTYLRRRITHFGIDTSHFNWGRPLPGKDAFEAAAMKSKSVASVMRMLGFKPEGGTQRRIVRHMRRLGIDMSHFTGQAHFRDKRSPRRLPPEAILIVRPLGSHREKPPRLRRALTESGVPYKCAGCQMDGTWMGGSITLHVDHINGDYLDCRLPNLRFLCPNCHALTWNFAGRGKARPKNAGIEDVG